MKFDFLITGVILEILTLKNTLLLQGETDDLFKMISPSTSLWGSVIYSENHARISWAKKLELFLRGYLNGEADIRFKAKILFPSLF